MTKHSNNHCEQLVDQLVYARVCKHINLEGLRQLEEELAIEIGKLADINIPEMIAISHALIDRALLRFAQDGVRASTWEKERELHLGYMNWLCGLHDQSPKGAQS
jgi:hypothetical protein